MPLKGFQRYNKKEAEKYNKYRWWLGFTWGDLFNKATDLYPKKEALVDDTSRHTYLELREKVDRLAVGFIDLGIEKGDFVMLQLPNWNEFIYSFFALQKIGAIVVLLIARHGKAEINYLCKLTKPKAWILPMRYGKADYGQLIDDIRTENSQLQHIVTVRSESSQNFNKLEELIDQVSIDKVSPRSFDERRPDPEDVSIIIPTGGTTGLPKAVPRTHNDFIANVEYHSKAWEITSEDTILTVAPVSHGQGMLCGLGASFFNYSIYVLMDSTRPEEICTRIENE